VKRAYTALTSLVFLLADNQNGTLGRLSYSIGGNTTDLRHQLFKKSNGTFYIAFWLEKSSYASMRQAAERRRR
jgi:hypothetical protein